MQSLGHLRLKILHEAHGEFPLIFFFKKKIVNQRKQRIMRLRVGVVCVFIMV